MIKINTVDEFQQALAAGKIKYVGSGSERGYVACSRYPFGRFCGVVKRGFRRGCFKFQPCGRGLCGSTLYCINEYYVEV